MTAPLLVFFGYLVGSIPFGLLIGLSLGTDIRTKGSKNIGATNVGRVLGRPWGLLAFALDFGKGVLPVLAAAVMLSTIPSRNATVHASWWWIAVATATIAGHMFPVWLGFKGGKGVATGFGAMIALWPAVTYAAAAALLVWCAVAYATKYVSVASVAAAVTLPMATLALAAAGVTQPGDGIAARITAAMPFLATTLLLAGLVTWRHKANFGRLKAGTESRIGAAKPAPRLTHPVSPGARTAK